MEIDSLLETFSKSSNSDNKITKKNKNKDSSKTNIKTLWNLFDEECDSNKQTKLECIYRSNVTDIEDDETFSLQNLQKEFCNLCNCHLFVGEDNFLVCPNKKCGIIYKDNLDQSAEWRFYGAEDNNSDPTRCGMPINPLLRESSYSCKILCPSKSSYEMYKIKKYTDWQSMPYKEKSQYDEFQYITNMSQNAGIPKMIIDDAMHYHKKISCTKTFRGVNRDGIIAASIYISCRVTNYIRTAKEIADIFNLDNTSATKGCKNALAIINEIDREKRDLSEKSEIIKLNKTTPLTFIERYCSKLNINNELTQLCKFIATKIEKNNLIPENTPHSIAGGIIYFVSQICNLNITKATINNISKISEVTINKCNKKLEQHKNELIPAVILKKYNQ